MIADEDLKLRADENEKLFVIYENYLKNATGYEYSDDSGDEDLVVLWTTRLLIRYIR